MLALLVTGILAAIAYPAYSRQLQRSRRADALVALTVVMQAQERHRSQSSQYATTLTELPQVRIADLTPHYRVTLTGLGPESSFITGYQATATPLPGGPQASDSTCKRLSVTVEGAMTRYAATGDPGQRGSDTDTTALCWPR